MVPLETVFVGLVLLFGIIGALRGWAKEILVTFSVILARFIEFLLLWDKIPIISGFFTNMQAADAKNWFYFRMSVFLLVVISGYATTVVSEKLSDKARKDKFQDTLLGLFLGVLNGALVVGLFWGFLDEAKYGIWNIRGPEGTSIALTFAQNLTTKWLNGPLVFIGVAVSFVFVLIVFV
ncbi:MAG: CvpA family protein [Anaerolineae bacterium]